MSLIAKWHEEILILIQGDVEVTTPEKTFTPKQRETIDLSEDDEYYLKNICELLIMFWQVSTHQYSMINKNSMANSGEIMDQFEQCIKDGTIIKIEIDPEIISRELKEAESDLETSERSAAENIFKWATIQGHHSLQHSFNALLFSKGYSAIGNQCLISGIKKFFVSAGIFDEYYIKDFEYSHKISEGEELEYNNKEDFAIHIMSSAGDILEIARNETGY